MLRTVHVRSKTTCVHAAALFLPFFLLLSFCAETIFQWCVNANGDAGIDRSIVVCKKSKMLFHIVYPRCGKIKSYFVFIV